MVQPNGPLVVITRVRLLQLGLDLLEFAQLVVGDVERCPRGQLPADVSLHVRDVGDVPPGYRQHREAEITAAKQPEAEGRVDISFPNATTPPVPTPAQPSDTK